MSTALQESLREAGLAPKPGPHTAAILRDSNPERPYRGVRTPDLIRLRGDIERAGSRGIYTHRLVVLELMARGIGS